ncbi:MAG: tetratricopeptide repeat protein [Acidobacteria bacterium]|nr:tetratricopeptide repeat protein [Acidobacteriota bacterium]
MLVTLLLLSALAAADQTAAAKAYAEGRFVEAATLYHALLQSSPGDGALLGGLGKVLVAMHRPAEAMTYLSRAVQMLPDRDLRRAMAEALQELNQFFEAEKLLRDLTRSAPRDGESWRLLGSLLYHNGYYGSALQSLDKALALQPANKTVKIQRAVSLMRLARTQEAEAACLELLADPSTAKNLDVLLSYVQVLYESGRLEAARHQADEALAVGAENAMAHFWKGRILYQLGRMEEALREAGRAVQIAPQLPAPRTLLLKVCQRLGLNEEAGRQVEWLRSLEDQKARRERR